MKNVKQKMKWKQKYINNNEISSNISRKWKVILRKLVMCEEK